MTPLEHLKIAMEAADAFYKERGIFQSRFGFGKSPALVVIDMSYGWTDPAYAGGSARLDSAVTALQKLLPMARKRQLPIIYTTSSADDVYMFKSAADKSTSFRPWDRRACEIDERVRPMKGEYIVYKEHASAFAGTAMLGHLVEKRVDTLLITGCSTSACVRATATDAKTFRLKPSLIREAVQDRCEVAHEWTLFDIQARFADVVSLEQTMIYLESLRP